ncbi:hypothetical protein ALQ85_200000 [Pseudomonas syringae]|nr:hypothetical protein ALQ85_200000 [Pseudomonas syringae]
MLARRNQGHRLRAVAAVDKAQSCGASYSPFLNCNGFKRNTGCLIAELTALSLYFLVSRPSNFKMLYTSVALVLLDFQNFTTDCCYFLMSQHLLSG